MPDLKGKLTQEEKAKIIRWMEKKASTSSCPVCGGSHWVLAEHLIWGLVHTPDFVMGGVNYPLYLTFCDSFYYTRHFMAVPVLGDIQHKDPDQEDAEAANG